MAANQDSEGPAREARTAGGVSTGPRPLGPDLFEIILAAAAVALFALVAIAVIRGMSGWAGISPVIWIHLASVMLALLITPVQLLRRRGDRMHGTLGWIWAALLFGSAWVSLGIRDINDGDFSPIHALSALTILMVPLLVFAARTHRIAPHRYIVRFLVTGALVVAGYFTLLPNRMLGSWLWG